MSRYFLKKVWGFSPDSYPVLGFPPSGGRSKFLREGSPEDWVVLAGTKGPETDEEDQGRLLGMVRLGSSPVDVEAVLLSLGTPIRKIDRKENGDYRWPEGLPMIEARRFVDRPDVSLVFGNYLPGEEWAAYAICLDKKFSPEVVSHLASLPTEPIDITLSPIIAGQVAVHEGMRSNRGGPTGPAPSDHRDAVDRAPTGGFGYLFRLRVPNSARGSTPVFKVGRAVDVEARRCDLNRGLLTSVTGFSWEHVTAQRFQTEDQAHRFEQALHARLRRYLVEGENEVYRMPPGDIETEWMGIYRSGEWATAQDK